MAESKHAFWQAFIVTVAIFIIGIVIGIVIEGSRTSEIEGFYVQSELSLMDILALNSMINTGNYSCDLMISSDLEFADRIYEEAVLLEDYENAGKLTDELTVTHKRYDLLRTFLWVNSEKTREICGGNFNVVVYLYEQETEDLAQKATQNVWSKILFDLKQRNGASIILIPIAVDGGLVSVDSKVAQYDIKSFPVVIVNGEVVSTLESVEELEQLLI